MSISHLDDEFRSDAFVGIYDHSYAPLALGDSITWQMNLCVGAAESGIRRIVQYHIADLTRGFYFAQPYITANSYLDHINKLFPVFLTCPNTSAIHWVSDKGAFDWFFLRRIAGRVPTWPTAGSHFRGQLDVTSYKLINRFYRKHGFIPRLLPPKGYEQSMDAFLQRYCPDRFVVSVNVRQRRFQPNAGVQGPRSFARDSALCEWHRFFRIVGQTYPDVAFVILGGYSEWARELYSYTNILIPRAMGYQLPHELTLLHRSDLFMGTLSGFAAMATFSTVPFIATNPELATAAPFEIAVGDPRLHFALEHQTICWQPETSDRLIELFEPVYHALRSRPDAVSRNTEPAEVPSAH